MVQIDPNEDRCVEVEGVEHYVEGDINGWLLISVPETTSADTAQTIKETAQRTFGRPVLVFTHNVNFVKLVKLSPKETAARIKKAEIDAEQEEAEAAARLQDMRRALIDQSAGGGRGDIEHGPGDTGGPVSESDAGESVVGGDTSDAGEGAEVDENESVG